MLSGTIQKLELGGPWDLTHGISSLRTDSHPQRVLGDQPLFNSGSSILHCFWVHPCPSVSTSYWMMLSRTFWNFQQCHPPSLPMAEGLHGICGSSSLLKLPHYRGFLSRSLQHFLFPIWWDVGSHRTTVIFMITWYCKDCLCDSTEHIWKANLMWTS